MRNNVEFDRKSHTILLISLVLSLAIAVFLIVAATRPQTVGAESNFVDATLLPGVEAVDPTPMCRFGINAVDDITAVDTAALRMGWYVDYLAKADPETPNGAAYVPTIRLKQVGADGYRYSPTGSSLINAIQGNPGAEWLIGNEPDRRQYQDDLEPHVYAAAYHELYHLIKAEDPTAKIIAGTIVQPTPLRLQYLDMVLASYQSTHGIPMPVDGWSIHNFILNEVSCDYDPGNCWGAEIPPGIDADFGEVLTIDDNDNFDLFTDRIERFRQWMSDNGYRDTPLLLSEYGILMPDWLGFSTTRVNTFMTNTFDYLMTATDASLGYPADGNRMVQKWSWYSTTDDLFNGYLFDPNTLAISAMGQNYANFTAPLAEGVDVLPDVISVSPPSPIAPSGSIDLTVMAEIVNVGTSNQSTGSLDVRFFDGDPSEGGAQIGATQQVILTGGSSDTVSAEWPAVPAGMNTVYVTVESADGECSTLNNNADYQFLVGTVGLMLPTVQQ